MMGAISLQHNTGDYYSVCPLASLLIWLAESKEDWEVSYIVVFLLALRPS